ncbi:occludin b [Megalops cyprinoides]|uniref:occludin b n=1 Tax=Megalops cyprinoides TaxID=118141 RepID=UPI00186513B7|nr:occludin b [Megalops cyprinoides]
MTTGHKGSPPPYQPGSGRHHGSRHRERSRTHSYYPHDEFLHFYRWTSPPGVMKIMAIIIIILCVAIFACVASTLAWDMDMGLTGFGGIGGVGTGVGGGSYAGGGYGGSYGGSYGSSYGGSYGGYGGIGGNYTDPLTGKGFIIAIAAITFIAVLIIFILVVSRQNVSRSRRFYLATIIIGAILSILMLISTIVYLVAINPTAQTSGTVYYNQIIALCAQYQNQNAQPSGIFINQYLYHYCVVEPQEAIAVVFGFLVTIGLIILVVFAAKTRAKIRRHGKDNILWEEVKVVNDGLSHDVGEWVNNVSGMPEVLVSSYNDKLGGSRILLDDNSTDYTKPPYSSEPPEQDLPLFSPAYSSPSDMPSSVSKPNKKRPGRARRIDGQDYDTDYATGAESGEELDDNDFDSEFPPITNEQDRLDYKREFERDLQEYKGLQSNLDDINRRLAEVDRELDVLHEGSPQYLDAMDEYTQLRNQKKSADYQMKKRRCKYLKAKLAHIKRRVSGYDHRA